jgi:hypothetical protein
MLKSVVKVEKDSFTVKKQTVLSKSTAILMLLINISHRKICDLFIYIYNEFIQITNFLSKSFLINF